MGVQKKKINLLSVILLLAGAALTVTAIIFMFFADLTSKDTAKKEAVDVYEVKAKDEPVFLNLQYMSESVAYLEAVESMQYYITFDSEWNPAVICLYDSELKNYQPYIDWMFTEEIENGPKEIKVTGYSVPFDDELRGFVIESYNALYGEEVLTKRNFESNFGDYYLALGQSNKNYEKFNIGIYCLIGAVICIVLGIAVSYNTLKQSDDEEDEVNCLELKKTNKGRGILGAFLGALLGGVLWAAVGALGYISGWIGILTVLFATTGYKMFAKEESSFGTVISVIFSLIIVLPATYLAGVWDFYQELNKNVAEYVTLGRAFQGFGDFLSDNDGWGSMIYNIVMGYIFMIGAGGYSISAMLKKEKNDAAQWTNVNIKNDVDSIEK